MNPTSCIVKTCLTSNEKILGTALVARTVLVLVPILVLARGDVDLSGVLSITKPSADLKITYFGTKPKASRKSLTFVRERMPK